MAHDSAAAGPPDAGQTARRQGSFGIVDLFLLFGRLSLSSFGGGAAAWMHRAIVERRRWLGEAEFAGAVALGRLVPGASAVNLAVLIGQRLRGAPGAAAALLGLLAGPCLIAVVLAVVYRRFADSILLQAAVEGLAAAAAGLMIALGVVSARRIARGVAGSRSHRLRGIGGLAIVAATALAIGWLHLPTVPVVLCLAPISIALAHRTAECAREPGHE